MRKIILGIAFFTGFATISNKTYSQVAISGPTCVMPGTVCEYTITGNWDSTSTMSVCINGGAIYDAADSNECTLTGPPVARVLVDWDTSGTWSLILTSTLGNSVLQVSAITPLTPGSIDSVSKIQMIAHDSIPATITCSADAGGSCAPNYSYQWQQSPDMAEWADIPGATDTTLSFSDTLKQSTFFRRKVTETISGTIGASDAAAVYIVTQPHDSTRADSSSTGFNGHIFKQRNKEIRLLRNRCGFAPYNTSYETFLTGKEALPFIFMQGYKKATSPGNCLCAFEPCDPFHEIFLLNLLKNGNQQPA
jgi:hypothetical protein